MRSVFLLNVKNNWCCFCLYIIQIYLFQKHRQSPLCYDRKTGFKCVWSLCNAITMSLQICKYAALMIKDKFIIEFKKMYSDCKWCLSMCDTLTACHSFKMVYRWLYKQSNTGLLLTYRALHLWTSWPVLPRSIIKLLLRQNGSINIK